MSTGRIEYAVLQGTHVFKLVGEIRAMTCSSLDHLLDKITQDPALTGALVDLTDTTFVDSTTLGVLAKLGLHLRTQRDIQPIMLSTNPDITTLTNSMGLGQVFVMMNCKTASQCTYTLPEEKPEAHAMLETVLEAHQALMNLNDNNKAMFQPLVNQLENEHRQQQQASQNFSCSQQHH
ncbi:STAS domain-containing protein [Aquirhabdus parva]|uniref:Anti-sigma factor antagonist n=1 Tax=Aquirhabdus parva TaxID=2283318 RepID=A0A345P2N7_9GAMM|nr:STAS domain-containing protein [Aquirhabdus parva]AXI01546.1 anti-sigma factor antagonist [Aquirhabdus parva]